MLQTQEVVKMKFQLYIFTEDLIPDWTRLYGALGTAALGRAPGPRRVVSNTIAKY